MSEQQTITEFLTARLDEDEAAAKAAEGTNWGQCDRMNPYVIHDVGVYKPTIPTPGRIITAERPETRVHIIRHDPSRVLREIEAKRAILAEYDAAVRRKNEEWEHYTDWVDGNARGSRPTVEGPDPKRIPGLERAIRHLAAVYSDRRGYREEWRS